MTQRVCFEINLTGRIIMRRIAKCCCGSTSITVDDDPKLHVVCHCDNCKTRTGSAFGISAYFMDSQVVDKQGQTTTYEIDTEQTRQTRHFCSRCGTTLYWKITRFAGLQDFSMLTGVAGGCFVDNPLPPPTVTANNAKRCAWLQLSEMKRVEPNH
jgi:hypothetical protein